MSVAKRTANMSGVRFGLVGFATALLAWSSLVRAASDAIPPSPEIPQTLSLDETVRLARSRGLDTLIAQAQVVVAEGQVQTADAVPNPVVSGAWGRVFGYDPGSISACSGCSATVWSAGLSDSAAIIDSLAGKRELRQKAARNLLEAAKMSRADAERAVTFQAKAAYLQIAQAALAYQFAKEVADSDAKTLSVVQTRFDSGAINEGDLARVQTQKLEADQALDQSSQALRQSRVSLAFILGVRGAVPDFDVDASVLKFARPQALLRTTETGLLHDAFERRPDLIAFGYQRASAAAQIDLQRRERFPDIALNVNYSQTGTGQNALSPPTLTVGVSIPLPVFYQMAGEVRQAEGQYDATSLQQAKAAAQVVNDVATTYAGVVAAGKLVERMEGGGLLQSARTARDVTRLQYEKGAASLTDFLDAQRTYISASQEYFGDLTNYWTAVFQLEEAVGEELTK